MTQLPTQFDMFSDDPAAVVEGSSDPQGKRSPGRAMTEQDMVEHLTASGNYRVLRKLAPGQSQLPSVQSFR